MPTFEEALQTLAPYIEQPRYEKLTPKKKQAEVGKLAEETELGQWPGDEKSLDALSKAKTYPELNTLSRERRDVFGQVERARKQTSEINAADAAQEQTRQRSSPDFRDRAKTLGHDILDRFFPETKPPSDSPVPTGVPTTSPPRQQPVQTPDSLGPPGPLPAAPSTSRFQVDEGEIVDTKAGQIIPFDRFEKVSTPQEKAEVLPLLSEHHKYDYAAAKEAGVSQDPVTGHWDSRFKHDDNPRRFLPSESGIYDSKYNKIIPKQTFDQVATPDQKEEYAQNQPLPAKEVQGYLGQGQSASTPTAPIDKPGMPPGPSTPQIDPRTGQPIPVLKNEPAPLMGVERIPQIVQEQAKAGVSGFFNSMSMRLRHFQEHPEEASPLNAIAMKVRELTGRTYKMDLVTPVADLMDSISNFLKTSKQPITPESVPELVAAGVTRFVTETAPDIAVMRRLTGNIALGFGLQGLLKGSEYEDQDGKPIFNGLNMHGAQSALINLATIGILHGLAPTSRVVRAGAGAAIGGGVTAAQGGSPQQTVADAITFAALSSLAPGNPQFMRLWGEQWNKPKPPPGTPKDVTPKPPPAGVTGPTAEPPGPPPPAPTPKPTGVPVGVTPGVSAEPPPEALKTPVAPPPSVQPPAPIVVPGPNAAPAQPPQPVAQMPQPQPMVGPPGPTQPVAEPKKAPAAPTVEDIHALADAKGIPYDNDKAFMDLTQKTTGKRHLDDLGPVGLQQMADVLKGMKGKPATGDFLARPEVVKPRSELAPADSEHVLLRAEKGPEQMGIAIPPETIGSRPIIGREAQPEEAPLFSKAAQTREPDQTTLPEEKPEPTAVLAKHLRTAADEIEGKKPAGIQDVGEKIGGARKDKWAERGLTLKDLEGMTGGEEAKYVTKANVWRPDYAAMVKAGAESKAAALVKIVYDQLAAKPKTDTPEGRRAYVTMMGHIKKIYADVKTVKEVEAARHELFENTLKWATQSRDPAARAIVFSVYKHRSEPFHIGYGEHRKAHKMLAEGFPTQEPWTRRYMVREIPANNLTADGAKFYAARILKSDDPWGKTFKDAETLATQITEHGIAEIREKASGGIIGYRLDKASAETEAKRLYETKTSATGDALEPTRPHLDELKREGENYRGDKDVTAEDFRKAFGFRGVEFGNWAASDERQKHVNQAYDALRDLAEVLRIAPEAISLNGTLGLAFGARGSGKAAAHYEPSKLVINITKINGPGSLAHEWGHAMDHYFGELKRPDAYKGKARGASGWREMAGISKQGRLENLRPALAKAFDDLMTTLFTRNKTKADVVRERELHLEKIQGDLANAVQRLEQAKEKPVAERNLDFITQMQAVVATYKARSEAVGKSLAEVQGDEKPAGGYGKIKTSYYKAAETLSGKTGDYWKRPTELLARSFESYVFDRLGRQSDYLVHGVEGDRYTTEKGFKENPYPAGEERTAINAAYDHVFDIMESNPVNKGELGSAPANPFSRPTPEPVVGSNSEDGYFHSSDPDVEARYKVAAKGISKERLTEKLKEFWDTFKRRSTRKYEYLPDTAEFAPLQFALDNLEKQKGISNELQMRALHEIVGKLSDPKMDLFTRKVILMDLTKEAEAGRLLPYGYTPESVARDLADVDQLLTLNPDVQTSWEQRQALWQDMKRRYSQAMDEDVAKKISKEDYFRHQVLAHAQEIGATKGTGDRIRTPSGRSFLKTRQGSTYDINGNYLQAEFEVLAQMDFDIHVAQVIDLLRRPEYNIQPKLQEQARQANEAAFRAELQQQEQGSALEEDWKHVRQMLAFHMKKLKQALHLEEDETVPMAEINRLAADPEADGHASALGVFKWINRRRALIKATLGEKFKTWEDLIPDAYDGFQPREGNIFYMADTIPHQMVQHLMERMGETMGITAADLKKVLAMGGKRETLVLKKEIVQTLTAMQKPEYSIAQRAWAEIQGSWKAGKLVGPHSFFKYNLRNLSGDAEAAFVGNPSSFKYAPRAVKDLLPVFMGRKTLTGPVKDWFERGGMGTLLQINEMGDVNDLTIFKHLQERSEKRGLLSIPAKVFAKYWRTARLATDFREAILRYANYLDYLNQLENLGGLKNYGASIRATVDALEDPKDKAFKLSNELIGAYDRISVNGAHLRRYWMPFWSWKEVNFSRYKQLIKNAFHDRDYSSGARAAAFKSASTLLKLAFAYGALQVWNHLVFPEEEQDLNERTRNRVHIILPPGRTADGKITYLDGIGAIGDLLSWVGLDGAFSHLVSGDLLHDRMTIKELSIEMLKAPFNVLTQALGPLPAKLPAELFAQKSSFPDVFNPQAIRDPAQHVAQQLTPFGPEYNAATGKPGKPYLGLDSMRNLVTSTQDPGSAAYHNWQAIEDKWRGRMGKPSFASYQRSPKGQALADWSQSLRMRDQSGIEKYKQQFIAAGGDLKSMVASVRALAPLNGLTKDEKAYVLGQLDAREKEVLKKAEKYYLDEMMKILPPLQRSELIGSLMEHGGLSPAIIPRKTLPPKIPDVLNRVP